jgi:2-keto-4-pentenoate hydratase/2-oxohepta-3-ene-1,7-dioic acid hydratase in catechol pathway
MKLATYTFRDTISCGIITENGVIDIPAHTQGNEALRSIREILSKGQSVFEILSGLSATVHKKIPLDAIRLLAPIPRPGKILALAGNYKKHLEETAWQDQTFDDQASTTNPWPFIMPSTVIAAAGTEIQWPAYSEEVDYEIELAIVIGQKAKNVTAEEASSCIAGYTIANDISARSTTFKEGRKERPRDVYFDWLMGKWSDGFLPLGPWLVTADEVGNPQELGLELKVNGRTRQKSYTSQMIFDVFEIVSFISRLMTLEPGDVIITGTPHGVAVADGSFLMPGDTMECKIEKIGTLTNTLGPKPDTFYKGLIR